MSSRRAASESSGTSRSPSCPSTRPTAWHASSSRRPATSTPSTSPARAGPHLSIWTCSSRTWGFRLPRAASRSFTAPCDGSTSATRSSALARCSRSEEHTSELQSHHDLVCRLLLEKKKKKTKKKNQQKKKKRKNK